MCLAEDDRARREAEVSPEVLAVLRDLFIERVVEAAREVCPAEMAAKFEMRLAETMAE
jgi:hypothetical protein